MMKKSDYDRVRVLTFEAPNDETTEFHVLATYTARIKVQLFKAKHRKDTAKDDKKKGKKNPALKNSATDDQPLIWRREWDGRSKAYGKNHEFEQPDKDEKKDSKYFYVFPTEDGSAHYLAYSFGDKFDFLLLNPKLCDTNDLIINKVKLASLFMKSTHAALEAGTLGNFSKGALIHINNPMEKDKPEPCWFLAIKLFGLDFGDKICELRGKKIDKLQKETLSKILLHEKEMEKIANALWNELKNSNISDVIFCRKIALAAPAILENAVELYKITNDVPPCIDKEINDL